MRALTAEVLTAGYGRVPVIRDVTVHADSGEVTTIVGPNGAGKSTFAKTLAGILRPTAGRVAVGETDITRMPGHKIPQHGLAYVPQNDNVFPNLTVTENLEISGYVVRGRSDARIAKVFEVFPDLAKARTKKAGQLSGGQQNLLAMARALMVEPTVVVLDEPTAGLSPAYTGVMWEQIEAMAESGAAVVVVEQNVDRALAHSQVVYILVAGTNYRHGPVAEIAQLDLGGIFLGKDQPSETTSGSAAAPPGKETS